MKTIKAICLMLAVLVFAAEGMAQTSLGRTTLSAAVTAATQTTVVVGSATGITAGTTGIFVDAEYMTVSAINTVGSVVLTVRRGQGSSQVTTHASGVDVLIGPQADGPFRTSANGLSGSCTRGNYSYLPLIVTTSGDLYNCWNSQWYKQDRPGTVVRAGNRMCNVANGGSATLALGVSTTAAAGTVYVSSIYVPTTRWVTGLSVLNGGTVGTSLTVVALYDAAGNKIANSSTAGISGGTASTFWDITFGTALLVTGPAKYHIGVQAQGATSTLTLLGAGAGFGDIFGNLRAGTLGTLPAITIPSAFTSVQAPVGCLY